MTDYHNNVPPTAPENTVYKPDYQRFQCIFLYSYKIFFKGFANFYLTNQKGNGYTNIIRPYYKRTAKQSTYVTENNVLGFSMSWSTSHDIKTI